LQRYIVIGGIGLGLVVAALVLNEIWISDERPQPAPTAAVQQPAATTAPTVPPATPAPTSSAPLPSAPAPVAATPAPAAPASAPAPTPAPAAVAKPVAPSFDIVRVNPRGDTVVAGRAEPNAAVTILDGDKALGKVQADGRGEWVWVPNEPLGPGNRNLNLSAQGQGGSVVRSEASVVLVVPERDKDIAGQPAAAPTQPLALMVPREGAGPSTVLQAPVAPEAATRPAPGAAPPPLPASPGAAASAPHMAAAPAPPVVVSAPQVVASAAPAAAARARPAGMALTVDALDYDERGRVSFSGRTEASGRILAYIDNALSGRADADSRGAWSLKPNVELKVGAHQLRVDLVEDAGKVLARVELIFYRAPMVADASKPGSIVIQPGNNLWRIARHTYGAGIQYTLIFNANRDQIRDPDLIYPGQVFALPPVN